MARLGPWMALGAILAVALVLHTANPIGQPGIWWDEGTYIRRAIQLPRDGSLYPANGNANVAYYGIQYYGHPFLAWGLLGAFLWTLGYPGDLLGRPDSVSTLAAYFLVPRAFMIALTILDVVLVFEVGRRTLGKTLHGVLAAGLFALSPLSRQFHYVQLDNFMAFWVLVALDGALVASAARGRRALLAWSLAGAAMGLALLSKLPALFFAPVPLLLLREDLGRIVGNLRGLLAGTPRPSTRGAWARPLLFTLAAMVVVATWLLYALARRELGALENGLVLFGGRAQGGFGLYDLLGSQFLAVDPVLFGLGLAGLAYGLVRGERVATASTLGYLLYLVWLDFRIRYYFLPLVPFFAILGGVILGDGAIFVGTLLHRLPGVRRVRQAIPRAAVAAAVALVLVFPGTATVATLGVDDSTPGLQAVEWVVENAVPYSVVVTNRAYLFAVEERRPDVWALHTVQGELYMLEHAYATNLTGPVRFQVLTEGGGVLNDVFFRGALGSVQLATGTYRVQAWKNTTYLGETRVYLDRDEALVFIDPLLPAGNLVSPHAPGSPGVHTLTVLDPLAMPLYYVDDGMFNLPGGLRTALRETRVWANSSANSTFSLGLPRGVYRIAIFSGGVISSTHLVSVGGPGNKVLFASDGSPDYTVRTSLQGVTGNYTLRFTVTKADGSVAPWVWVEVWRTPQVAAFANEEAHAVVSILQPQDVVQAGIPARVVSH